MNLTKRFPLFRMNSGLLKQPQFREHFLISNKYVKYKKLRLSILVVVLVKEILKNLE